MSKPGLYNVSWLNANSNRNYPLDDAATKQDDSGKRLPVELLADLNLWYPQTLGSFVFISGVTITDQMVSFTLSAREHRPYQQSGSYSDASLFVPIAAVTVVKPVDIGRAYALRPFNSGVGGWVNFGTAVNELPTESYRFSTPAATGLLPKLTRAYPIGYGVSSVRKQGFTTAVTGPLTLISGDDDLLKIAVQTVTINSQSVQAIVLELNEQGTQGRDIYSQFIGPCGGNPESLTCRLAPIYNMNGATPDCDGVITLYVQEVTSDGTDATADLTVSYASTKNDGTEPIDTSPPSGHTVNFDYNRGMRDICVTSAVGQLAQDRSDPCDDPCGTDFAGNSTPYTNADGTAKPVQGLNNTCVVWHTGVRTEPGNENGNEFLKIGPAFQLKITGQSDVLINGNSDDIFMLIPGDQGIAQSPDNASYVPGGSVTFTVPPGTLFFNDTYGCIISADYQTDQLHLTASCDKTVTDGTRSWTWPGGGPANDQTGHVSDMLSTGFPLANWNSRISVALLQSLGLAIVDSQGDLILFAKPAHIVSGKGFANMEIICPLPDMTTQCSSLVSSHG